MMKNIALTAIILLSAINLNGQGTDFCPCCSPEYKKFDFWIGSWIVYDTTNTKVGESHIQSAQNNCVIIENWNSPNSTGTSMNFYNRADSSWNQIWIDNVGNPLFLKGGIIDGRMVMTSELTRGIKIEWYYNRIIWEKRSDGTVVQTWFVLDSNYKTISTLFKGIYRKK